MLLSFPKKPYVLSCDGNNSLHSNGASVGSMSTTGSVVSSSSMGCSTIVGGCVSFGFDTCSKMSHFDILMGVIGFGMCRGVLAREPLADDDEEATPGWRHGSKSQHCPRSMNKSNSQV